MKNINSLIKQEIKKTRQEIKNKLNNKEIEVYIDFKYEIKGNIVNDSVFIIVADDSKEVKFETISPAFIFIDDITKIIKKIMETEKNYKEVFDNLSKNLTFIFNMTYFEEY